MLEKSSEVVLSDHEKKVILGEQKLTKSAGNGTDPGVPDRFVGYYALDELKELVNEQN